MTMTSGMYSSATCEWATPPEVFDPLNAEFGFQVDVCATPDNAKCRVFWTERDDGLRQEWHRGIRHWMNPPYGREIGKWMEKAHEAGDKGATVVCLVPARTDTAWWHDHAAHADEIRFVRGRIKFGNSKQGAPFPSAIVIWRGDDR